VRETFPCQKLGDEHNEERTEQEEVDDEAGVTIFIADTPTDKGDSLPESEKESGKKECTDKWIEDRIRRVVVSPILIAEKIVFDERKRECSCKSPYDISMIYFPFSSKSTYFFVSAGSERR